MMPLSNAGVCLISIGNGIEYGRMRAHNLNDKISCIILGMIGIDKGNDVFFRPCVESLLPLSLFSPSSSSSSFPLATFFLLAILRIMGGRSIIILLNNSNQSAPN